MANILVVTADGGGNLAVTLPIVAELVRRGHDAHVLFRPLIPGTPVPTGVSSRATAVGATVATVSDDAWATPSSRPAAEATGDYAQFSPLRLYGRSAPLFVPIALAVAGLLRTHNFDAVVVDGHHAPTVAAEAAGVPSILLVTNISWTRILPGLPAPGRGTLPTDFDETVEATATKRYQAGLDELVLPHLNDAREALGLPTVATFSLQETADLQLVAASQPSTSFPTASLRTCGGSASCATTPTRRRRGARRGRTTIGVRWSS